MIDREWYLDRLGKALNAIHMEAISVIAEGINPQDSQFITRFKAISMTLQDELVFVVQNEDANNFVERLEHFIDGMLESWIASLESTMPYDKLERSVVFVHKSDRHPADDAPNP